jgi:parallel beta-helix repeat protein
MRSHCTNRRAAVFALAAVLLVSGRASGALAATTVLYVDNGSPSCSDTGVGSQTQPFCTIGAAAAVVTAGETVQVASGLYPESVAIKKSGTSVSPIVFTAAPGATVTLSGQTDGFSISGQAWVTVKGFTVTNTSSFGIYVSSSSHITVSGNHVSHSGHPVSGQTATGIRLSGTTDSLVRGNTADHNTYAGIEVNSSSTRNEVRGNTTFANASVYTRRAPGIRLYQAPGNTIDRNISHENEDSGIECYPGANNSLIYNNVSYRNGDHGIDDNGCPGNRIFGNTVYKNVTAGINVEGSSTGGTIANNVSVDNGIKSPRTHGDIRIERGSTAGTTVDNDLVYLATTDTLLIWDSVSYTTLAAFQAASGQEMRAIVADPRWVSTSASDFHLRAGSPAIDSADSGVSGWPNTDIAGLGRVDDPATANTGLGPRSYDDRGAYEYQPSGDLPPTASLTLSPVSGTAPLAVTADASASSDGDATPIASYRFDFGDGTMVGPQTAASAAHTFQTAGTYTVTVTVTDTAGLSSTATGTVQVGSATDRPPTASLTLSPVSGTAPLAVTADASASSDGDATPIASYRFDFGDGTMVGPQTAASAAHTFQTAGTYTVTVTVTDTAGLSSTVTATATVQAGSSDLVGNPGFEADLTGWSKSGSDPNVALSRVAGGHTGSWAAELSNTGSTNATSVLNDSPNWALKTSAGTYTGSIWVRADTAGGTLKLRFREYSGSTLVGSATTEATLSTSWQQVTVTHAVSSPGSTLDFNAYVAQASPGVVFYADDASITQS